MIVGTALQGESLQDEPLWLSAVELGQGQALSLRKNFAKKPLFQQALNGKSLTMNHELRTINRFYVSATIFLIVSVVRDFGRSMARPKALSQISWAKTPMARETPNNTV